MKKKEEINDLLNYNKIKIIQNSDYFKFSLDSVLLPNFVIINKTTKNILDLCTGNAPVPLILSTRTKAKIYGIEIQKEIYDLAVESVKINNLDNQITIINNDINNIYNEFKSDMFDIITCNPPYFKYIDSSIKNNNDVKAIARHEIYIKLEDIFKISRKLLKNNGQLYIIHRTERLIDIVELMRKYKIEPKLIQFIYSHEGDDSKLIMISGTKNGKPGIRVLSPLIIHDKYDNYCDKIKKMFS